MKHKYSAVYSKIWKYDDNCVFCAAQSNVQVDVVDKWEK